MVRKLNDRLFSERLARRAEVRRGEILRAAARVFRRRGFSEAGRQDLEAEMLAAADAHTGEVVWGPLAIAR